MFVVVLYYKWSWQIHAYNCDLYTRMLEYTANNAEHDEVSFYSPIWVPVEATGSIKTVIRT